MSSDNWFIAPNGFKTMKAGVPYCLLRSDPILLRVLLVTFLNPRHYDLVILARADFEEALDPESRKMPASIHRITKPDKRPTWLQRLEEMDPDTMPSLTQPRGLRDDGTECPAHSETVNARVRHILDAVKVFNEVLGDLNPDRVLNRYATKCEPRQNETRFRMWFYLYLAYGRSRWALLPPMFTTGTYDRLDPAYEGTKFGRKSEQNGAKFGFGLSKDMVTKILNGFHKHVKKARTFDDLWASIVITEFGCKAVQSNRSSGSKACVIHPTGQPFPSANQVYYQCRKTVGKLEYRRLLYGEQRTRGDDAAVVGRYSDSLTNLMEVANFDARHIKELPKGYASGAVFPPLLAIELIDALSGRNVGIGFSLGSEIDDAYLASLFCAAIPKSKFGQIIGMTISDGEWPGHGLPISIISDRGPGASEAVRRALDRWHVEPEMTPSYTPQSNSTAESKHPKHRKRLGAPQHFASNLTPIDLIRRAVEQLLNQNRTASALSRATPRMILQSQVTTPDDLWNEMYAKSRISTIQIGFEDAVRTFLRPVKFVVKNGKLHLHEIRYDSSELMATPFAIRMRKIDGAAVDGYVFPMAVRKAWVQVNDKLIEVDAKLPARHGDSDLDLTLGEIEDYAAQLSKLETARRVQKGPEAVLSMQRFEQTTGHQWNEGSFKQGRPKKKTLAVLDDVIRSK
jgi:hypothetical protein